LFAQGKPSEATAAIHHAANLVTANTSFPVQFEVSLAAARIQAASGSGGLADARKKLQSTLAEAARHGYVRYVYETRLAMGELGLKSGNAAESRARLQALGNEAAAKGFGLIARKALRISSGG
jgi:hypothetical protein